MIRRALFAAVLLTTGCASPGPIRRALDSDVGVICYYTRTAMSCLPVQVKKRGHKTDEASAPTSSPADPTHKTTAGTPGKRRH